MTCHSEHDAGAAPSPQSAEPRSSPTASTVEATGAKTAAMTEVTDETTGRTGAKTGAVEGCSGADPQGAAGPGGLTAAPTLHPPTPQQRQLELASA